MDAMQLKEKFPQEFYQTLTRVMGEENASLTGFEENLDRQYEVLIAQKLPEFLQVLKEQRGLIAQSYADQGVRGGAIKNFLPDMHEWSLGDLILSCPEEYREVLGDLKGQFDRRVDRIRRKQERNKRLIHKSLDMLMNQIEYLKNIHQPGYDASGNPESNDFSVINKRA